MKPRMAILAALFGLAILTAPAVASAHPIHRWQRPMAAERLRTMGPRARFNFMRHHPHFARRRWQFNNGNAYRDGFGGVRSYTFGRGRWGQGIGYLNQEPDDDRYGYPASYQFGGYGDEDGDSDDGGYAGYGMPIRRYGYGNPYYGGNYGMLGAIVPMLQGYAQ